MPNQPAEMASQRNDLRHTPPALVNAAEKNASEPQVLYVIFQTHRIDDSGALMITTSVWRVRVLKPSPKAMTPEVNPRST
jgi:hypothetical protein